MRTKEQYIEGLRKMKETFISTAARLIVMTKSSFPP